MSEAGGINLGPHDDNFENFVSNWSLFRDRLVVFLGAGASIGAQNDSNAQLLNAYELRNDMWSHFKEDASSFDPASLRLMSLEHAAAIIESKVGRLPMVEYLLQKFSCTKPMWQHAALPYLKPRSLFTTNYDELIELGYARAGGQVLDVICGDRAPFLGRPALFKPHGSLTHADQPIGQGGLVITQFDYLEMIVEYRSMLQKAVTELGGKCVLIIGYSFGDMDIGAALYRTRKERSDIPWYTVFPRNDPNVRDMYLKRFGIRQINRTFETFMADLDERIGFLPETNKYNKKDALKKAGTLQ